MFQHRCAGRASCGFTLIELMVVLTLVSVLLAVGAPALSGLLSGVRLSAANNALVHALLLGRSEAIKRGGRVVICKSNDGRACTRSGNWEQGWIVFHDRDNNAQVNDGESIVHHEQPLAQGLKLSGNRPVVNYVSYTPLGQTRTTGGGLQAGTFTACEFARSGHEARQIVISHTGRPRSKRQRVEACD